VLCACRCFLHCVLWRVPCAQRHGRAAVPCTRCCLRSALLSVTLVCSFAPTRRPCLSCPRCVRACVRARDGSTAQCCAAFLVPVPVRACVCLCVRACVYVLCACVCVCVLLTSQCTFARQECTVPAADEDFDTEFLTLTLAVKVVPDIADAVAWINAHGSHHTDAIVTEDAAAAEYFFQVRVLMTFRATWRCMQGGNVTATTSRVHVCRYVCMCVLMCTCSAWTAPVCTTTRRRASQTGSGTASGLRSASAPTAFTRAGLWASRVCSSTSTASMVVAAARVTTARGWARSRTCTQRCRGCCPRSLRDAQFASCSRHDGCSRHALTTAANLAPCSFTRSDDGTVTHITMHRLINARTHVSAVHVSVVDRCKERQHRPDLQRTQQREHAASQHAHTAQGGTAEPTHRRVAVHDDDFVGHGANSDRERHVGKWSVRRPRHVQAERAVGRELPAHATAVRPRDTDTGDRCEAAPRTKQVPNGYACTPSIGRENPSSLPIKRVTLPHTHEHET
jgi:hypothetical protein